MSCATPIIIRGETKLRKVSLLQADGATPRPISDLLASPDGAKVEIYQSVHDAGKMKMVLKKAAVLGVDEELTVSGISGEENVLLFEYTATLTATLCPGTLIEVWTFKEHDTDFPADGDIRTDKIRYDKIVVQ